MRQITPLTLPDLKITGSSNDLDLPTFDIVSPNDLYVDDAYQRNLSDRSMKLIRKIAEQWRWSAFKPPICVRVDEKLYIIDGQHTAFGAATRGLTAIPVMVIPYIELADRAGSFVRHNRDRIAVTPLQLHHAMIAAGDEQALALEKIANETGIKILRNPPSGGVFKEGDTMAIRGLQTLLERRRLIGATRVLKICATAGLTPVSADVLKAVETLCFDAEYKGQIEDDRIIVLLRTLYPKLVEEALRFAAERKLVIGRALASVIFMHRNRKVVKGN